MKRLIALVILIITFMSLSYVHIDHKSYKATTGESVAGIGVLLDQLTTDEIMTAYNKGVD